MSVQLWLLVEEAEVGELRPTPHNSSVSPKSCPPRTGPFSQSLQLVSASGSAHA